MKVFIRGVLVGLLSLNSLFCSNAEIVDDGEEKVCEGVEKVTISASQLIVCPDVLKRDVSGGGGLCRTGSNGSLPGSCSPITKGPRKSVRSAEAREAMLNSLTYGRATMDDVAEIMGLYHRFTKDDTLRLLVFPDPYQERFLQKSISKGRVFVARTKGEQKIVSFLKLFVVNDSAELRSILCDEFRAVCLLDSVELASMSAAELAARGLRRDSNIAALSIMSDEQMKTAGLNPLDINLFVERTVHEEGSCKLDVSFAHNFVSLPAYLGPGEHFPFRYSPRNTYIYDGSAYTVEEYRGWGVNFRLEEEALAFIAPDVTASVMKKGSPDIYYMYGVVDANAGGTAHLRTFSAGIRALLRLCNLPIIEPIKVSSYAFRTCKPSFGVDTEDRLVQLADDDENAGFGTLIGYRIRE
ncbi:hypothetical protein FJ364_02290 [Candidatus Dependentiae bacterium]|nr:hypothetical protein [Candidatus Dependentiae bacterium]